MTVIYAVTEVEDTPTGNYYVTTKRLALRIARDVVAEGHIAHVRRCKVAKLPKRELVTRLLNNDGWAASSEEILTLEPKEREVDE
jgi:hypothetical protein